MTSNIARIGKSRTAEVYGMEHPLNKVPHHVQMVVRNRTLGGGMFEVFSTLAIRCLLTDLMTNRRVRPSGRTKINPPLACIFHSMRGRRLLLLYNKYREHSLFLHCGAVDGLDPVFSAFGLILKYVVPAKLEQ